MDVTAALDPWLARVAHQVTWLAELPPAYIALAGLVPLLIALISRQLLAVLWTALFAASTVALCATQDVHWTLLATFGALVSFLLVITLVILNKNNRIAREELIGLQKRVDALEANEQRKWLMVAR